MAPSPRRLELHELLVNLLGAGDRVYFQPPTGHQMKYPCIVYSQDDESRQHADNSTYRHTKRWQVTVIDRDPDSDIPDRVSGLPLCAFDRRFPKDNLNHTVYNLYF